MKLKIYLTCIKISIAQATAYRADFIMSTFITLLSNIFFPLVTIVIYANGLEFPGWTMWAVLALQSIFSLSRGIASMCLSSVMWATMDHVRGGSFETVLLKPISPLFYIMTTNFSVSQIGLVVGSAVVLTVSLINTGVSGVLGVLSAIVLLQLRKLSASDLRTGLKDRDGICDPCRDDRIASGRGTLKRSRATLLSWAHPVRTGAHVRSMDLQPYDKAL